MHGDKPRMRMMKVRNNNFSLFKFFSSFIPSLLSLNRINPKQLTERKQMNEAIIRYD